MLNETLSIKVSTTEKNLLRQAAAEAKSSPSRLLRDALQLVLAGAATQRSTLREKHRHLFSRLDQGPGDLSTNPKHLRDFGK